MLTVLDEVERKAIDLGVVTQAELRRWHASLQALEAEGGVFCTATRIMVAGRKAWYRLASIAGSGCSTGTDVTRSAVDAGRWCAD